MNKKWYSYKFKYPRKLYTINCRKLKYFKMFHGIPTLFIILKLPSAAEESFHKNFSQLYYFMLLYTFYGILTRLFSSLCDFSYRISLWKKKETKVYWIITSELLQGKLDDFLSNPICLNHSCSFSSLWHFKNWFNEVLWKSSSLSTLSSSVDYTRKVCYRLIFLFSWKAINFLDLWKYSHNCKLVKHFASLPLILGDQRNTENPRRNPLWI